MTARYWTLGIGVLLSLTGAALVFALDDPEETVTIIALQPLGGILLAVGIVLLGVVGVSGLTGGGSRRGSGGCPGASSPDSNSVKAVGGLIAVVAGIGAVALLAIVTITRFDSTEQDSAIALASSAFGVISAVVGAYLGIKVTADHSTEVKNTALAEQETAVTKEELQSIKEKVEEVVPADQAVQVMAAGVRGSENPGEDPGQQGAGQGA